MAIVQTTAQTKQEFLDSLYLVSHSTKTQQTYLTGINHFSKFTKTKYDLDEQEIINQINSGELDVYQVLRNFVIYLDQQKIRSQGLRSYLSGVKGFLRHCGIRINSDDYKQLVKIPRIKRTREIALTKEMLVRILRNSSSKLQTAILISCSGGLRIGELVQLRLSDIDFTSNPTKINIRGETAKGGISRETFITTEATIALKDYLKKYFGWREEGSNLELQNKVIFGRISKNNFGIVSKNAVEASKRTLQEALRREIIKIPELALKNENERLAIHFHAFRKFFRTTLGNVCGRDYAEALMGHGFYMDTYYQLPEDKKKQMYLEAEPHLIISDSVAIEKTVDNLEQKYESVENRLNWIYNAIKEKKLHVPDKYMKEVLDTLNPNSS